MKLTKKQQIKINNFMRDHDIDHSSIRHMNCVRFHPKEGKWHRITKCKICSEIYNSGRPFWTEVITKNKKKRYDIIDPLEDGIIEVVDKHDTNRKEKVKKIFRTEETCRNDVYMPDL